MDISNLLHQQHNSHQHNSKVTLVVHLTKDTEVTWRIHHKQLTTIEGEEEEEEDHNHSTHTGAKFSWVIKLSVTISSHRLMRQMCQLVSFGNIFRLVVSFSCLL